MQIIWRALFKGSSGDYGTLSFFRDRLGRSTITKDYKKDVNAVVDFLETVVKGHWLACACSILGTGSVDDHLTIPKHRSDEEKKMFESIARKVVERVGVISSSFLDCGTDDTHDKVYNYARVLCHYGSLVMELQDGWSEGDGDRVLRVWKLALPHFQVAKRTKYSLESLRLQFQVNAVLSPNLAHQVKWHRFVNTKGGAGRNVPCDLHNEHVNKLIKNIISNMGSNLTEQALQRAVRSISTLDRLCRKYDSQTDVPHTTSAHSTRSDAADIKKVVTIVLQRKILQPIDGRQHQAFPRIHFNPLHTWNSEKTKKWIELKKKHYQRCNYKYRTQDIENDSGEESEDNEIA